MLLEMILKISRELLRSLSFLCFWKPDELRLCLLIRLLLLRVRFHEFYRVVASLNPIRPVKNGSRPAYSYMGTP